MVFLQERCSLFANIPIRFFGGADLRGVNWDARETSERSATGYQKHDRNPKNEKHVNYVPVSIEVDVNLTKNAFVSLVAVVLKEAADQLIFTLI